jgi:hypothetical protein
MPLRGFKFVKGRWGRRRTFRLGATAPLVTLFAFSRSWAPATPGRGSSNREVVAAMGTPQCVRGSHHCRSHFLAASAYRFSHGRQQPDQKHGKEKIIVRTTL